MQKNEKKTTKNEKKGRYDLSAILSVSANYNVVFGARTNGKSYQVKWYVLKQCYDSGSKFIYLRRWAKEATIEKTEKYFADMVEDDEGNKRIYEITHGKYDTFDIWRNSIYFAKTNEETGKKERGIEIGYVMKICEAEDYKGSAFPKFDYLLWEEFITNRGYVPREMEKFFSIISTVFRARVGNVFMVANTIATMCPAFIEWGIEAIKLKQGTITVYNHETLQLGDEPVKIKIAVEYTESKVTQAMIFGKHKKMIVDGDWETRDYPKLPENLSFYRQWYTIYMIYRDFKFVIRLLSDSNKYSFLYVYPYTKETLPDNARVVTDTIKLDYMYTVNLSIYRTKYDRLVYQLLNDSRVVFSDNLTATSFYQTLVTLGHTQFRRFYYE